MEQLPEPYYHKIVDHTLDDLLERLEVCCCPALCWFAAAAGTGFGASSASCAAPIMLVATAIIRKHSARMWWLLRMVGWGQVAPQSSRMPLPSPPRSLQYFVEELDYLDADVEYSVSA